MGPVSPGNRYARPAAESGGYLGRVLAHPLVHFAVAHFLCHSYPSLSQLRIGERTVPQSLVLLLLRHAPLPLLNRHHSWRRRVLRKWNLLAPARWGDRGALGRVQSFDRNTSRRWHVGTRRVIRH
eukprot:1328474-Rhodomonas_salina.1